VVNREVNLALEEVLSLVHAYLLAIGIRSNGFSAGSISTTITTYTKASLQTNGHKYEQQYGM
jgi:hypothetical protein